MNGKLKQEPQLKFRIQWRGFILVLRSLVFALSPPFFFSPTPQLIWCLHSSPDEEEAKRGQVHMHMPQRVLSTERFDWRLFAIGRSIDLAAAGCRSHTTLILTLWLHLGMWVGVFQSPVRLVVHLRIWGSRTGRGMRYRVYPGTIESLRLEEERTNLPRRASPPRYVGRRERQWHCTNSNCQKFRSCLGSPMDADVSTDQCNSPVLGLRYNWCSYLKYRRIKFSKGTK